MATEPSSEKALEEKAPADAALVAEPEKSSLHASAELLRGGGEPATRLISEAVVAAAAAAAIIRIPEPKEREAEAEDVPPPPPKKVAKKYQCEFPGCTKQFSTATEKTNHYRRHTGDKPYGCDTCGKAFVAKGQLRRHMVIHTGEKSFVCEVCNKAFNQRSNLKVHMRTHKQDKGFACVYPGCTVMYKHRWLLREHMLRHPNDEELTIEIANREEEIIKLKDEMVKIREFEKFRRDLLDYKDSYYVTKANNLPSQVGRPPAAKVPPPASLEVIAAGASDLKHAADPKSPTSAEQAFIVSSAMMINDRHISTFELSERIAESSRQPRGDLSALHPQEQSRKRPHGEISEGGDEASNDEADDAVDKSSLRVPQILRV